MMGFFSESIRLGVSPVEGVGVGCPVGQVVSNTDNNVDFSVHIVPDAMTASFSKLIAASWLSRQAYPENENFS
jgi:hypothetical protein